MWSHVTMLGRVGNWNDWTAIKVLPRILPSYFLTFFFSFLIWTVNSGDCPCQYMAKGIRCALTSSDSIFTLFGFFRTEKLISTYIYDWLNVLSHFFMDSIYCSEFIWVSIWILWSSGQGSFTSIRLTFTIGRARPENLNLSPNLLIRGILKYGLFIPFTLRGYDGPCWMVRENSSM